MRLDHLIHMLETHNYYVSRRRVFDDANECYENAKLAFPIAPAKEYGLPKQELGERIIPYFDIIHCPTSCWTKNTEEQYFMWKMYATEIGVCVKSTVHHLIASLNLNLEQDGNNKIICGSMNYKEKIIPSTKERSQLFDKDRAYAAEDEFRFYFHLGDDTNKKTTNHILISIDKKTMIDEIVLSPFICKEVADKLARMIKCSYGINDVKQSNINIK